MFWWHDIEAGYLGRAVLILWLGAIATYYLTRLNPDIRVRGQRSLDIIIAFFGTYGRAKELEKNLHQTQERFRLLVQNATDLILIMDRSGIITDCNNSAQRILNVSADSIYHTSFQSMTGISPDFWDTLFEDDDHDYNQDNTGEPNRIAPDSAEKKSIQCSCLVPTSDRQVDFTFSTVTIAGEKMLFVFGHDITERLRFEKEREDLRNQIFHSQRLESIGRLAGGIAHDFNNYLQAIQGNLDMIQYMHPVEDQDVNRFLNKIDTITGKASLLTQQLLGFARKGNYHETDIQLKQLVDSALELFMPDSSALTIQMDPLPDSETLFIRGNMIQLQQTILNIMFNARYAMREMPERNRSILISYGSTEAMNLSFNPP